MSDLFLFWLSLMKGGCFLFLVFLMLEKLESFLKGVFFYVYCFLSLFMVIIIITVFGFWFFFIGGGCYYFCVLFFDLLGYVFWKEGLWDNVELVLKDFKEKDIFGGGILINVLVSNKGNSKDKVNGDKDKGGGDFFFYGSSEGCFGFGSLIKLFRDFIFKWPEVLDFFKTFFFILSSVEGLLLFGKYCLKENFLFDWFFRMIFIIIFVVFFGLGLLFFFCWMIVSVFGLMFLICCLFFSLEEVKYFFVCFKDFLFSVFDSFEWVLEALESQVFVTEYMGVPFFNVYESVHLFVHSILDDYTFSGFFFMLKFELESFFPCLSGFFLGFSFVCDCFFSFSDCVGKVCWSLDGFFSKEGFDKWYNLEGFVSFLGFVFCLVWNFSVSFEVNVLDSYWFAALCKGLGVAFDFYGDVFYKPSFMFSSGFWSFWVKFEKMMEIIAFEKVANLIKYKSELSVYLYPWYLSSKVEVVAFYKELCFIIRDYYVLVEDKCWGFFWWCVCFFFYFLGSGVWCFFSCLGYWFGMFFVAVLKGFSYFLVSGVFVFLKWLFSSFCCFCYCSGYNLLLVWVPCFLSFVLCLIINFFWDIKSILFWFVNFCDYSSYIFKTCEDWGWFFFVSFIGWIYSCFFSLLGLFVVVFFYFLISYGFFYLYEFVFLVITFLWMSKSGIVFFIYVFINFAGVIFCAMFHNFLLILEYFLSIVISDYKYNFVSFLLEFSYVVFVIMFCVIVWGYDFWDFVDLFVEVYKMLKSGFFGK